MLEKKTTVITFESVKDFRNRFFYLWKNQKEDEIYEFNFLCKEAEKEFQKIEMVFK
jgi:hypothetical protein